MSFTLTVSGDVYRADAEERYDIIRFSPSVTLDDLEHKLRLRLADGETVSVSLPDDVDANTVLVFFHQGSADMTIWQGHTNIIVPINKMFMIMGSGITMLDFTATDSDVDTVFDVIMGN